MALPRVARIGGYIDVEGDPVAYVRVDDVEYLLRAELINALGVPPSWVEPRALTVFVRMNSWEKRQLVPRDHLNDILEHVESMRRLEDLRDGINDDDDFIVPDDYIEVRDDESSEQEHEGYADDEHSDEGESLPPSTNPDEIILVDDPAPHTLSPRVITDDDDPVDGSVDSRVTDDPAETSSRQPAKKRRMLVAEDS